MPILIPLLVALALLAALQLALAAGAPWGRIAWGGAHRGRLPGRLRLASLAAAVGTGVFAWLALECARVTTVLPGGLAIAAGWVLVGVFALSTLANLVSKSRAERAIMAPIAGAITVLAVLLALGVGAGGAGRVDYGPGANASGGTGASAAAHAAADAGAGLPAGFVRVERLDPAIQAELRYATANNFTGRVVDGYQHADAIVLREDAAKALVGVQHDLAARGLGLRVYDAFRPTRAVADFVAWSKTADESTRAEYYPDQRKPQLFELGYIAEKSGHSLGGTVDLTLVDLATNQPLDMGGTFDFFGERSHYDFAGITSQQRENRDILHRAMLARGFEPYPLEWWHFSFPVPEGTPRLNFVLP